MHKCLKCNTEFDGKFCSNCGTKWEDEKICPECGAKLSGEVKFCNNCGHSFVTVNSEPSKPVVQESSADVIAVKKTIHNIASKVLAFGFIVFTLIAILACFLPSAKMPEFSWGETTYGGETENLFQLITSDDNIGDVKSSAIVLLVFIAIAVLVSIFSFVTQKNNNLLKKQKISGNIYVTNQTILAIVELLSTIAVLIVSIVLKNNIKEYGLGIIESGAAITLWIVFSSIVLAVIAVALTLATYLYYTTPEIKQDVDAKNVIKPVLVASPNEACPKCGEKLHGLFCTECRTQFQDANDVHEEPNIFTKIYERIKKTFGKFAIVKILALVVVATLAIVLLVNQPWNYLIHQKNAATIELDMTKEKVEEILGKPNSTGDDENTWYYFDGKFAKKYAEYELVLEGEDLSAAIEKYNELAGTEYTLTMIKFVNDQVVEVLYDKEHLYNEFDRYESKSELETVSIYEPIVGLQNESTSAFSLVTKIYSCAYQADFSNGGFIKSKLLNYSSSLKYELADDKKTMSISWKDEIFEYSLSKPVVLNYFDKLGYYSLGEGVQNVTKDYFSSIEEQVCKLHISSSVTDISDDALTALTNLETITVASNNSIFSVSDGILYKNKQEIVWLSPTISGSITIPEGVTTIGTEFSNCANITEIVIPASVSNISNDAFDNCVNLKKIDVNSGNENYFSQGGILYYNASWYKDVKYVPMKVSGEIVLAEGVNYIEDEFVGRKGITSISIPQSVTSINAGAFAGCSALRTMTLPFVGASNTAQDERKEAMFGYIFGNTEYDGSVAVRQACGDPIFANSYVTFYLPTNLTKVTVTGSKIHYGAFSNCSQLSEIVLQNTTSIEPYAFWECSNITNIVLPEGVVSIGEGAFESCTKLTSVSIPSTITFIDWSAFYECDSLNYSQFDNAYYLGNESNPHVVLIKAINRDITSCDIHSSTKMLYNGAFGSCVNLTSVTIPNNITNVGESAFSGCTSLNSITLSNGMSTIAPYMFRGCSNLTSFTVPKNITNIGASAFESCTALNSISIHDAVTSIGESAFNGCDALTAITVPNSVTEIGKSAFANSSNLKDVTLNAQITGLPANIFENCTSLKNVTLPSSLTDIGQYAFANCTSITSITLPQSLIRIASYAFRACDSLESLTIPANVNSIGNYAFEYCTSLQSLSFINSSGWKHYTNSSNSVDISLATPSQNATYFRSTYADRNWKRN